MEIKYLGHASFAVKGKNARVIFDPFDPTFVGLPFKKMEADVVCVSHEHSDHNFLGNIDGLPYVVRGPGEYEVRGVKITGLSTFHDDTEGSQRGKNTVYTAEVDGVVLCHLGDLGHKLLDRQLGDMEKVDILFIPVGGFYTIDPKTAVEVIAQVEPRVVIPMHFRSPQMKPAFESLATLEDFIKEIGETPRTEKVLKVSREDLAAEGVSLVALENSML